MADNFLEKRYDEVFGRNSGTKSVQRLHQSLDTLLKRTAQDDYGFDESYILKEIQVKRIIAATESQVFLSGTCPFSFSFQIVENSVASVTLSGNSTEFGDGQEWLIDAGIAFQTIRLKSADLGLATRFESFSMDADGSCFIIVNIGHPVFD